MLIYAIFLSPTNGRSPRFFAKQFFYLFVSKQFFFHKKRYHPMKCWSFLDPFFWFPGASNKGLVFGVSAGSLPFYKKSEKKTGWIFVQLNRHPAILVVKVSFGDIITSNSLGGMGPGIPDQTTDGPEVRTGEDLWRQSDQSTLWGLTDLTGSANHTEMTKWNKARDPKYLHIHHSSYLKMCFG